MIQKHTKKEILDFIVNDFEKAWNLLCAPTTTQSGGGNFMFALLGMILLEFACRDLCGGNASKLMALETALAKEDPGYFTPFPGDWGKPASPKPRGWVLPGGRPYDTMLAMLFDVIRHGKAHAYQSAAVELDGGKVLEVDIAGPRPDRLIDSTRTRPTPSHLSYWATSNGDLRILFRPDQFFVDVRNAIHGANLTLAGTGAWFERKKPGLTVAALVNHLSRGGHSADQWP